MGTYEETNEGRSNVVLCLSIDRSVFIHDYVLSDISSLPFSKREGPSAWLSKN
jgi:hypothetical protein